MAWPIPGLRWRASSHVRTAAAGRAIRRGTCSRAAAPGATPRSGTRSRTACRQPRRRSRGWGGAGSGCLLTEYPPGAPPLAHHFPERNRLIAGLAEAVIVVEADERSGALITARLALDEGREVLAVPGSVCSRLSAGPNGLLRAGAAPVLSADDVLAAIGLPPRAAAVRS